MSFMQFGTDRRIKSAWVRHVAAQMIRELLERRVVANAYPSHMVGGRLVFGAHLERVHSARNPCQL